DVALIQHAIVQAELAGVPEFDPARAHAETGPARRPRYVAALELALGLGNARVEGLSRVQRLRLQRGPGADLAAARAAGEIGVGLLVRDHVHAALDPHLHAAAPAWPMEPQRRVR